MVPCLGDKKDEGCIRPEGPCCWSLSSSLQTGHCGIRHLEGRACSSSSASSKAATTKENPAHLETLSAPLPMPTPDTDLTSARGKTLDYHCFAGRARAHLVPIRPHPRQSLARLCKWCWLRPMLPEHPSSQQRPPSPPPSPCDTCTPWTPGWDAFDEWRALMPTASTRQLHGEPQACLRIPAHWALAHV